MFWNCCHHNIYLVVFTLISLICQKIYLMHWQLFLYSVAVNQRSFIHWILQFLLLQHLGAPLVQPPTMRKVVTMSQYFEIASVHNVPSFNHLLFWGFSCCWRHFCFLFCCFLLFLCRLLFWRWFWLQDQWFLSEFGRLWYSCHIFLQIMIFLHFMDLNHLLTCSSFSVSFLASLSSWDSMLRIRSKWSSCSLTLNAQTKVKSKNHTHSQYIRI